MEALEDSFVPGPEFKESEYDGMLKSIVSKADNKTPEDSAEEAAVRSSCTGAIGEAVCICVS